jgi:beta-lactamase class A
MTFMTNFPNRRAFLLSVAAVALTLAIPARATKKQQANSAEALLANLEGASGARLGVYALNTANGSLVCHRADERFPVCSTFKVILVSAILKRSTQIADLMQRRIKYMKTDLARYSPISEKHVNDGMTVTELCAAAIQYSDNTAANLLMQLLGGPSAVTAFARSIGNREFRLDRWETDLNAALPGDLRDTATPVSMAQSLQSLTLGDTLSVPHRKQLNEWLRGNTTGAKRIRAATSADWLIGDKTGSGDYGTANDIAVLWPLGRKPIVLAIYHTQKDADAKWQDEVIAAAARIVLNAFGLPTSDLVKPAKANPK